MTRFKPSLRDTLGHALGVAKTSAEIFFAMTLVVKATFFITGIYADPFGSGLIEFMEKLSIGMGFGFFTFIGEGFQLEAHISRAGWRNWRAALRNYNWADFSYDVFVANLFCGTIISVIIIKILETICF